MMTVRDVAKELGIPERTAYRWVAELRRHLNGEIARNGGRVTLSPAAVAIMRQIRQLRNEGLSLQEAIASLVGKEKLAASPAEDRQSSADRWRDATKIVDTVALAVIAAAMVAIAVALWVR